MSTADELDVLLYAWLSEQAAPRAELRFASYFKAAFPAICRFVRSLNTEPATAQDIAQQALIKLFNYLGSERRSADERVRQGVSNLRPLDFGPLHARRVELWRGHVSQFRDAAIGFGATFAAQGAVGEWKHLREETNERIPPLRRQGAHFIGEVHARVAPKFPELRRPEATAGAGHSGIAQLHIELEDEPAQGESLDPAVERFLEDLLRCVEGRAASDLDAALGCSGAVGFLTHTGAICTSLPALAIPSNGLLYTIAKRQLLDRLRAGRRESAEHVEQLAEGAGRSVLEELEIEGEASQSNIAAEPYAGARCEFASGEEEAEVEVEARYSAFLEFLRAPLTRAEAALAAATKTKVKIEQARVDSLTVKYRRMLAILAALRESPQPTEEEIARREGLTRNQVKYVIERIREEFTYFFADLARESEGRRKHQGAQI